MFDDIDKDIPCTIGNSCGDDFFADLDAEWDKEHKHDHECSPCGLMRTDYSIYNPQFTNFYADSFQPETDRIRDFAIQSQQVQPLTAAIVSCGMETPSYDYDNSRVDDNTLE